MERYIPAGSLVGRNEIKRKEKAATTIKAGTDICDRKPSCLVTGKARYKTNSTLAEPINKHRSPDIFGISEESSMPPSLPEENIEVRKLLS